MDGSCTEGASGIGGRGGIGRRRVWWVLDVNRGESTAELACHDDWAECERHAHRRWRTHAADEYSI